VTALTAAWIAEIVVIAWRDWVGKGASGDKHLPWPSELLATFILFGALSLAPEGEWGTAAAALGWGFVAATFLGAYEPGWVQKGG
jgi:hypothetical protein